MAKKKGRTLPVRAKQRLQRRSSFAEVADKVIHAWTFDQTHYPALAAMSDELVEAHGAAFMVGHLHKRLSAEVGVIGGLAGHMDHGKELDGTAVRECVIRLLRDILRLSDIIHLDPDLLLAHVQARAEERIRAGSEGRKP